MISREVIVVEYPSSTTQTAEACAEQLAHLKRCLAVREAVLVSTYASVDGSKLTRIFTAPDAGAVRYAHASSGFTHISVWAAEQRDTL